jgi:hypothetical protein
MCDYCICLLALGIRALMAWWYGWPPKQCDE